jgi:ArsR family transcriptional regulator
MFAVSSSDYEHAAMLLKALAHPGRLRIVHELAERDHCVHELVDLLGLAQPTVSQHLAVLRAARLVSSERVGKEQRYRLTDDHVAHIATDAIAHAAETG